MCGLQKMADILSVPNVSALSFGSFQLHRQVKSSSLQTSKVLFRFADGICFECLFLNSIFTLLNSLALHYCIESAPDLVLADC